MRAPAAACLWLLSLVPAAAGQEAFSDPDFGFRAQLPTGMRSATNEERAALLKLDPEKVRNVPRGEAAGAKISHSYLWFDDSTPYNRQIGLGLYDGMPPYQNPTALKNSQAKEGLSIEVAKLLPQLENAAYLEGTFLREVDKTPMRRILLYIPDFAAHRYAIMTMQAYAADWDIVKSDFEATVASVKMKLTKAPPPGAAGGVSSAARQGPDTNSWSSLPVTGSLLLAALLVGSLVFGRRSAA